MLWFFPTWYTISNMRRTYPKVWNVSVWSQSADPWVILCINSHAFWKDLVPSAHDDFSPLVESHKPSILHSLETSTDILCMNTWLAVYLVLHSAQGSSLLFSRLRIRTEQAAFSSFATNFFILIFRRAGGIHGAQDQNFHRATISSAPPTT